MDESSHIYAGAAKVRNSSQQTLSSPFLSFNKISVHSSRTFFSFKILFFHNNVLSESNPVHSLSFFRCTIRENSVDTPFAQERVYNLANPEGFLGLEYPAGHDVGRGIDSHKRFRNISYEK